MRQAEGKSGKVWTAGVKSCKGGNRRSRKPGRRKGQAGAKGERGGGGMGERKQKEEEGEVKRRGGGGTGGGGETERGERRGAREQGGRQTGR